MTKRQQYALIVGMSEKHPIYPCTECGRKMKNPNARRVHMMFGHKLTDAKVEELLNQAQAPASAGKIEPKQEEAMTEEKNTPACPHCQQKDAEAEAAKREAAILASQLAQEKAKPSPEPVETHAIPTQELFDHWANCPTCKPMLDERAKAIRANVIDTLDTAEISGAMQRLGIKPAPKELIIKGGR